jgi:hypothetical protein
MTATARAIDSPEAEAGPPFHAARSVAAQERFDHGLVPAIRDPRAFILDRNDNRIGRYDQAHQPPIANRIFDQVDHRTIQGTGICQEG